MSANSMMRRSKDNRRYKFVVDCLKNFKMLSFRENLDVDACKKMLMQPVTNNIDPVFLLTIEEWQ